MCKYEYLKKGQIKEDQNVEVVAISNKQYFAFNW